MHCHRLHYPGLRLLTPLPPLRGLILGLALLTVVPMLAGCALPQLEGRSQSQALPPAEAKATALGRELDGLASQHGALSGIRTLSDAREAFAARVLLARQAERTLDVQYYIWRDDTTGHLLLDELRQAADRGVRVRLLLDDNGIAGMDEVLALLDAHARVEVRLFNPFAFRAFKPLGFLTDFQRANRRMHNKSFTADNSATILGGRNVGDEYFGATDGVLFADLDVLAVGPPVAEVSASFDAYWSSASAYPIAALVDLPSTDVHEAYAARALAIDRSERATAYKEAVRAMPFFSRRSESDTPFVWAPARVVVDDPAKGLGAALPEQQLMHHMSDAIGVPTRTLDLVSPYFVPTDQGADYFIGLAQGGVRVRILTNSMAATDVLAVHSGYARHRARLVQGGVALYELKPDVDDAPARSAKGVGTRFSGSGSSLHAKTFGVDGERVFVGSFNFDPRSARLNTELGLVIDSPRLAAAMTEIFDKGVPNHSWQVQPAGQDTADLRWLDAGQQPPQTYDVEPVTRWWQRTYVRLLGMLPIEWML